MLISNKKKERYFQLCNLTFYSYFGPTVHAFMETIQIMTLENKEEKNILFVYKLIFNLQKKFKPEMVYIKYCHHQINKH